MASKIEWCEETWNPVVGCTKVSAGCEHCYAERMARRLVYMGQTKYRRVLEYSENILSGENVVNEAEYSFHGWNSKIYCDEKALDKPFHWRKPRRIFVNSMSDTFHKKVPWGFIEKVMATIEQCPEHTFQILTKRPHLMVEYFNSLGKRYELSNCPNAWLGVTCENQDNQWRIDELRKIPAAVKFVSFEPLLGLIPDINLEGIDWGIVGGESGPGARLMDPDWARCIRDQFVAVNKPFFFKQWGEYFPDEQLEAERKLHPGVMLPWPVSDGRIKTIDNQAYYHVGKKKAGCILDGREWKQYPGGTK